MNSKFSSLGQNEDEEEIKEEITVEYEDEAELIEDFDKNMVLENEPEVAKKKNNLDFYDKYEQFKSHKEMKKVKYTTSLSEK